MGGDLEYADQVTLARALAGPPRALIGVGARVAPHAERARAGSR